MRKESEKERGFVKKVKAVSLISSYFEIKSTDIRSIDIMELPVSFCVDKWNWMTEKHTLLAVTFIVHAQK